MDPEYRNDPQIDPEMIPTELLESRLMKRMKAFNTTLRIT